MASRGKDGLCERRQTAGGRNWGAGWDENPDETRVRAEALSGGGGGHCRNDSAAWSTEFKRVQKDEVEGRTEAAWRNLLSVWWPVTHWKG